MADGVAENRDVKKDGSSEASEQPVDEQSAEMPREIGGPKGPEPTRYGDWERNGRVSDF